MKISIITASYNSGKTIRHTVESVLRQTYPDFEYIVVDGGSTDNSIDIVKDYQVAFKGRLKWISEKDKGIYDAMNKGIRMATGDVVGILNSDDFYTDENVLQTVADNFMNHSVDEILFFKIILAILATFWLYASSSIFLLQERSIRQGWTLPFRLQDWFRL